MTCCSRMVSNRIKWLLIIVKPQMLRLNNAQLVFRRMFIPFHMQRINITHGMYGTSEEWPFSWQILKNVLPNPHKRHAIHHSVHKQICSQIKRFFLLNQHLRKYSLLPCLIIVSIKQMDPIYLSFFFNLFVSLLKKSSSENNISIYKVDFNSKQKQHWLKSKKKEHSLIHSKRKCRQKY